MSILSACKHCDHENELGRHKCENCNCPFRSSNEGRFLEDAMTTLDFLENAVCLDKDDPQISELAYEIAEVESNLNAAKERNTLISQTKRVPEYHGHAERTKLRRQIVKELSTMSRPASDDDIELKKGGAMPSGDIDSNHQATLVIGGAASGKSGIAVKIADNLNALILDSDYAKRKLPEYGKLIYGASLVHEEASALVFGLDAKSRPPAPLDKGLKKSLLDIALKKNYNIVAPITGKDTESVRAYRDRWIAEGYDVHLVLVSVDRAVTTARALARFIDSGRYVPLSTIFDSMANNPQLTYHRVKLDDEWASYGKLDNEVKRNDDPVRKESSSNSPINDL